MRCVVMLLIAAAAGSAAAMPGDETACAAAVASAEQQSSIIPRRLLAALAMVESGRMVGGKAVAWPWTVNVNGAGHFYNSKSDAVAAVHGFQAAGATSIDVGCMQINLLAHPHAFASLEDAFEPGPNVAYAARFVTALFQQTGLWGTAMTAYHSRSPAQADDYAHRLLTLMPELAAFGLGAGTVPKAGAPSATHDYTAAFARDVAQDRRLISGARRSNLLVSAPARGPAWPTRQR